MSDEAIEWAACAQQGRGLRPIARVVLLNLATHVEDGQDVAEVPNKELAHECGVSSRYIQTVVGELRDAGLIEVAEKAHQHAPNMWRLAIHAGRDDQPISTSQDTPDEENRPVALPPWVAADTRLSYRAAGLLARILANPGVKLHLRTLAALSPREGLVSVKAALTELEDAGYLRLSTHRRADGRWDTTGEVVLESRAGRP